MTGSDDQRLVRQMHAGDGATFDALFLRYYPQVYRVLYRLTGSCEMAEDLAQETFIELYRNPPKLQEGMPIVAWLCRVALNKGYNALRSDERAVRRAERWFEPPQPVDPEAELLRAEEHVRVRDALAQLPEKQNKLLLLRYAGLSYTEVAATLDVSPGSVGTLLVRAERALLAAYLSTEPAAQEEPVAPMEPSGSNERVRQ